MFDFNLFKIKLLEKAKIAMKSLLHLESTVNVDNKKLQLDSKQQYNIQITNNIFGDPDSAKKALEGLNENAPKPLEVSDMSLGNATLPEIKQEGQPKKILEEALVKYKKNEKLLLNIEELLFFYEERTNIDFTKEELVFLVQSSFKNNFPFWFWAFLYREKFDNVVPLFNEAYKTEDIKIRIKIVESIGKFTNTSEDIITLAHSEKDKEVLGKMIVEIHKDGNDVLAQRLITNAISREIIPSIEYSKIETLKAELGRAEKKYLHSVIEKGWPAERVQSLSILSVAVSEEDLPVLENLLERETGEASLGVLHCIARIGKTSKQDFIIKQLIETRWEKLFIQSLKTIKEIKARKVLPQLLYWLKNSSNLTSKYDLGDWKIRDYLKSAIQTLIDKEFYEEIIQDILSVPSTGHSKYSLWDQFNILEDVQDKEIIKLIKEETRLMEYPEWENLLESVTFNEARINGDKQALVDLLDTSNYTTKMLTFRELWRIVDSNESKALKHKIESLRQNLEERLRVFAMGNYQEDIKELARKDLDFFFDENDTYYRLWDARKKYLDGTNETPFSKLLDDINHFGIIEKEYIAFMLSKNDSDAKELLLKNLGRPFESIYKNIKPEWIEITKGDVDKKLSSIVKEHENPLIKLEALGAMFRMNILAKEQVLEIVIPIWKEARETLMGAGSRNDDKSFSARMVYYHSLNIFSEIGDAKYFPIIYESINQDPILHRHFGRCTYFHDIGVLRKLFEELELTDDRDEIDDINNTIDTLDYNWAKETLQIKG